MVVDSTVKSPSPPETGIDKEWALVARSRLVELRTGAVVAVPGDEVFLRVWHRFARGSSCR